MRTDFLLAVETETKVVLLELTFCWQLRVRVRLKLSESSVRTDSIVRTDFLLLGLLIAGVYILLEM